MGCCRRAAARPVPAWLGLAALPGAAASALGAPSHVLALTSSVASLRGQPPVVLAAGPSAVQQLAAAAARVTAAAHALARLRAAALALPPGAATSLRRGLPPEEAALLVGKGRYARSLQRRYTACQRHALEFLIAHGYEASRPVRRGPPGATHEARVLKQQVEMAFSISDSTAAAGQLAVRLEKLARELRTCLSRARAHLQPLLNADREARQARSRVPPAPTPPSASPRNVMDARGTGLEACSVAGIMGASKRFDSTLRGFGGRVLQSMLPPEVQNLQRVVHTMEALKHSLLNVLSNTVELDATITRDCQQYFAGVKQLETDFVHFRKAAD
uniref:Uncharacterized protein n=1 Tax=Pyrodinium bahamense TaxID=73915 RepID=A0A7S0AQ96_9DINO|mmetsp:Transcript_3957/g.10932  ORF Transcript_3957/g.10932 Transcript_3957/m.10932 type:complete len:331 (+) Transcript_3957:78-1070(+)